MTGIEKVQRMHGGKVNLVRSEHSSSSSSSVSSGPAGLDLTNSHFVKKLTVMRGLIALNNQMPPAPSQVKRCLFGIPSAESLDKVYAEAEARERIRCLDRWGFDVEKAAVLSNAECNERIATIYNQMDNVISTTKCVPNSVPALPSSRLISTTATTTISPTTQDDAQIPTISCESKAKDHIPPPSHSRKRKISEAKTNTTEITDYFKEKRARSISSCSTDSSKDHQLSE